jgi:aspartyl-tRNA(Asn)/glutamyl-tRNA(Gln) amidotransferase subunit A
MIAPDSALAIAGRVLEGSTSAVAVTEAALDRIAAGNPAINAIITTDPADSLRQAAALDTRLRAGERPPLAGIPIAIKDAVWVAGWRVTQGSRLWAEFRAPEDNVAVARLRRAGVIVVGMANMSEFGCKGVTSNPLHGVTRHPLDGRLTVGGSSGGSAAALAAGLVPLALGTDGGGSGRRPAAHAGVVGFKPSGGLVPDGPGFAGSGSLTSVLAPMARTVADAAALLDALLGGEELPKDSSRGPLRIAFSPTFGLHVPVDPEVADRIEEAVARLVAAGHTLVRVDPPWPAGASEAALMPMQWAGLAALHGETWQRDPGLFDPEIGRQIELGIALPPERVEAARAMAGAIAAAAASFFETADLLVGPTTPCVAWPHHQLGPATIAGEPVDDRAHAAFTPFFNHALCPAISIPAGTDRAGLPVGLQIAGPRFADRRVLAFAAEASA